MPREVMIVARTVLSLERLEINKCRYCHVAFHKGDMAVKLKHFQTCKQKALDIFLPYAHPGCLEQRRI